MARRHWGSAAVVNAIRALAGADYVRAAVMGVWYGSGWRGHDIDVAVVQEGDSASAGLILGRLDLFVIGRRKLELLASMLDPVVTEPILTGKFLFGQQQEWQEWRRRIRAATATDSCISHCARRSAEELIAADRLLAASQEGGEPDYARWALESLAFSISYLSFARCYAKPATRVTTLGALARDGFLLEPRFWKYRQSVKRRGVVDPAGVRRWLRRWTLKNPRQAP